MEKLSWYCVVGSLMMFGAAGTLYWLGMVAATVRVRLLAPAGGPAGAVADPDRWGSTLDQYGRLVQWFGFAALTAGLAFRVAATGHAPYTSQYEFSLAFAWGANAVYFWLSRRAPVRYVAPVFIVVPIGLIAYTMTISAKIEPLIPALQNNLLLTIHVAMAVVAYGGFTVAFAAAVLFLVNRHRVYPWLPDPRDLDRLAYRSIVVGFPMMFMNLVLGAVWANVAWGGYWSWDPKETAGLVVWLIYGIYLHAHSLRAWRGAPAAVLLIIGFIATLFCFFGVNLWIPGLHSYAGV